MPAPFYITPVIYKSYIIVALTDAAPVDGLGAKGLDMLPDVLVLGLV